MVSVRNAHINVHCVCIDNVTGIALTGFTIDAVPAAPAHSSLPAALPTVTP